MDISLSADGEQWREALAEYFGDHVCDERLIGSLRAPAALHVSAWKELATVGVHDLVLDTELAPPLRREMLWVTAYQLGYHGVAASLLANGLQPMVLLAAAGLSLTALTAEHDLIEDPVVVTASLAGAAFPPPDTQQVLVPAGAADGRRALALRPAGCGQWRLDLVGEERGLRRVPVDGSGTEPLLRLDLSEVTVDDSTLLARLDDRQVADASRTMRVWLATAMAGLAERLLDATVRQVTVRHQFGKPLSALQAVKHNVAEMALAAEAATLAGIDAMARLGGDLTEFEAVLAILTAHDALRVGALTAAQLHGGVGHIDEHVLPVFFRLAKAYQERTGPRAELCQRLGAAAGRRLDYSWDRWFS